MDIVVVLLKICVGVDLGFFEKGEVKGWGGGKGFRSLGVKFLEVCMYFWGFFGIFF